MQFALGQNLVSANAIFGYQLYGPILKCKKSFDAIYIYLYNIKIYCKIALEKPSFHFGFLS